MRRWTYIRENELYNFILENPGLSQSDICRKLQSKIGGTLRKLVKKGKVVYYNSKGRRKIYFAKKEV